MAGKIIIDTIDTDNAFITLNVQQSLIATMNVSGIYSNTGVKMIGANGAVSNTAITGLVTAAQIATVANTQITGNITSSQITSNPTFYGNVSVTGTLNTPNTFGFKNRIINGGMVIDQRNAGASVTPTNGQYSVDRWQFQVSQASKLTAQQSSVAPTGFSNSLLVTSTSTYSVVAADYFSVLQSIEGFNTADLAFGTASAATVTLSFWVRSSLTGTFGGTLINSAYSRAYPFTYTISNANTWEQKSVTITGDTTGTWIGATNGAGLQVNFGLGVGANNSGTAGAWTGSGKYSATGATSVVGTSGATFYITGVQLEKGSTATSFDFRDYGRELAMCQRYYFKIINDATGSSLGVGYNGSTTIAVIITNLPVPMRVRPTALEQSGTASNYSVAYLTTSAICTAVPTFNAANPNTATSIFTTTGLTAGQGVRGANDNVAAYLAWSAEL